MPKAPAKIIEIANIKILDFDKTGHRIGYGKGFYDRFLAECKPETLKIGLSFFEVEEGDFEASENDIRLDYCVTPNLVNKFKEKSF